MWLGQARLISHCVGIVGCSAGGDDTGGGRGSDWSLPRQVAARQCGAAARQGTARLGQAG